MSHLLNPGSYTALSCNIIKEFSVSALAVYHASLSLNILLHTFP